MVDLGQFVIVMVAFWLFVTYIAGRFDLQQYNLFVSSGFLIWKNNRLKEFLSRPSSKLFDTFQKMSVHGMIALFYAIPVILLVNFIRSYISTPAPIFEANPLEVLNFSVVLLVLPAIFVVGSIYQITRGRTQGAMDKEIESSGLMFLGVVLLFFSRSVDQLGELDIKKQLRAIATPFMVLLLFLLLIYPISAYSNNIITPFYHGSSGALVVNVVPDTPAQDKGLLSGDIIQGIKTLDDNVIVEEIAITSQVDYYSTLRSLATGEEFVLVLQRDEINIVGVDPPENSRVVGGAYIGLDTVDYNKPKIPFLSPSLPFIISTTLIWMVNISILYALYNVLPIPLGDGERLLRILLGRYSENPYLLRSLQIMYLGLFFINFFLG